MEVAALSLDPRDGRAVLVLVHEPTGRLFPLWLDDRDAASIARAHAGKRAVPPDSHELTAAIVDVVGCSVEHATLVGITGGVVRARLGLVFGDERVSLEARASDAVSLALRAKAALLVDEALLEQVAARVREAQARVSPSSGAAAEQVFQTQGERWNQLLDHLSSAPEGPLYEA